MVEGAWGTYGVERDRAGTAADEDVMVFEGAGRRLNVSVGSTRSERFIEIHSASVLTSEVWLLDAADPEGEFTVVAPRRQGLDYSVDHAGDRLLILHNDHAENCEIATAPLSAPRDWTPLVPHRADTRLLGMAAFADFIVVYFRRDGLTGLRILQNSGGEREIAFDEPIYRVGPGPNPEYDSSRFRLSYTSLVTPGSVYDCDMATGELTLLKRQPVLPSPAGDPYRPQDYEQHREWALAGDGTRVPISLVCRRDTPRAGSAPAVLYGYGSYETSMDPWFSVSRLSLLDRGVIFAVAHVRGGGEMGRRWYEEGKIHETLATEMVRSKSEVIVANTLDSLKVEYVYEEELRMADGSSRLPDFTIRPTGRLPIYWEHLGMLDRANLVADLWLGRAKRPFLTPVPWQGHYHTRNKPGLPKEWGNLDATCLSIDSSSRNSREFKTGAQLDACHGPRFLQQL